MLWMTRILYQKLLSISAAVLYSILECSSATADRLPNINDPKERQLLIETIKTANIEAAKILKQQLPQKNGPITTTGVFTSGLRVTYYGIIDLEPQEIDFNRIKETVTNNVCKLDETKPDYERELFNLGYKVGYEKQYIYVDKRDRLVGSFIVGNNTCEPKTADKSLPLNSIRCHDDKFTFLVTSSDVIDDKGHIRKGLNDWQKGSGRIKMFNKELNVETTEDAIVTYAASSAIFSMGFSNYRSNGTILLQVMVEDNETGHYSINSRPLMTPNKLTCER